MKKTCIVAGVLVLGVASYLLMCKNARDKMCALTEDFLDDIS